jgi:hypothetical protein
MLSISKKLCAIDPPQSLRNPSWLTTWPEGRLPELNAPLLNRLRIDLLYGLKTFELSALGKSDFAIHHTFVKLSTVLIRLIVTHWAGEGSLDGL